MSSPTLSVEQVDEQIRECELRIAELKGVRSAILKYGRNGKIEPGAPAVPKQQPIMRFPRVGVAPNTTGLKARILAMLDSLPLTFGPEKVVEVLQAEKFNFKGRRPRSAVRDCLYVLAKNNQGIRPKLDTPGWYVRIQL